MIEHEVLFWGTLWIQAGALLSLIAFRLPLGDQAHRFFHVLFYGSLAMVGSATVLALAVEALLDLPCHLLGSAHYWRRLRARASADQLGKRVRVLTG